MSHVEPSADLTYFPFVPIVTYLPCVTYFPFVPLHPLPISLRSLYCTIIYCTIIYYDFIPYHSIVYLSGPAEESKKFLFFIPLQVQNCLRLWPVSVLRFRLSQNLWNPWGFQKPTPRPSGAQENNNKVMSRKCVQCPISVLRFWVSDGLTQAES